MSLPALRPDDVGTRRPKPRLRALAPPRPARRPRLWYGVAAVAGAAAIAVAQMGLSILATQDAYTLADLTQQERALSWEAQILTDELAGLSSPQYLAANAAALGMVTGGAPGYLRLSDGALIGNAESAGWRSSINALERGAVGNALIAGVPLVTDPGSTMSTDVTIDEALLVDGATPPAITDGLPTPATH